MKRAILRRSAAVVAGATAIVLIGATAALAFNSPGKPPGTGPQNIVWTGQGVTNGNLDSADCSAQGDPNGANQPYLYWVLTPDGGSLQVDSTTPILHLGGSGSGDYVNLGLDSPTSNAVKFVTPFFDLSTLTANADMNILTTGSGSWGLKISHGCAGPGQASSPTVTKDAAGAFTTTWTWGIKKLVTSANQANAPPGGNATFNYEVDVTHTPSNGNVMVTGTIHIKNPNSVPIDIGPPSNVVDQLSNNVPCSLNNAPPDIMLNPGDNAFPYTCQIPAGSFDPTQTLTNTVTVNWNAQTLGDGSQLTAGQAQFTTGAITFSQTKVDDCAAVSDPAAPAGTFPPTVCAGDPSPDVFTYQASWPAGTPGTCTPYTNTASFVTVGPDATPVTGSDSATVSVCTGAPLTVTKTASPSLTRTYHWNISKSVDQPIIHVPGSGLGGTGPATVTPKYTLTITHDNGVDSGWLVTGQITVNNPNDWEAVTLTDLKDAIDNGGSCEVDGSPGLVIPKNGSLTYNYTCTYFAPPSPSAFHNVATASWDPAKAFTATGSATGEKDGDFANAQVTTVGQTATVQDTVGGSFGPFDATATPNSFPVNYPHTYTAPSGTCTDFPNLATITDSAKNSSSAGANVHVCVGQDLSVTKTANPSFQRKFTWGISKSVDNSKITNTGPATFNYTVAVTHDAGTDSNWQVKGTITVSNPNDWEAISLTGLTDVSTSGPCNIDPGQNISAPIPAASNGNPGTASYTYTCGPFSSAPNPSLVVDQAVANWDNVAASTPDNVASAYASADFTNLAPTTVIDGQVVVNDPQAPNPPLPAIVKSTDPSPTTFTYPLTFTDPGGTCTNHNNTATFTTSDTGTTGSSSQEVTHCVALPLNASKTAGASFDRTYAWNINKTASPASLVDGGTVTYKVTVNQAGPGTDGNWKVTGALTVNNPNTFESVSLGNVVDTTNVGGTCSFTGVGPSGVTIGAGATVGFPYICTFAQAPTNQTGDNHVQISWTAGGFSGPQSSVADAPFAFTNPTLHNAKITPTDSLNGAPPVNLCTLDTTKPCTLTATDPPAAPTSVTYNYTRTFGAPASGCPLITNVASTGLTGVGQTSQASVTNCTLGGLTMGFWHNSQGQPIIKASSTVGNWLYTTFGGAAGPYANMPGGASATGAQVAAYFLTVFSKATCSNNCAAMLSAQSFATALNVYFSAPALGGNKIGAPAPIGGVSVNVSQWAAAFGNPPGDLTVLQMLVYVSQHSNPGGTVYYGGGSAGSALTVLAAEAFNAINNNQIHS